MLFLGIVVVPWQRRRGSLRGSLEVAVAVAVVAAVVVKFRRRP